MKPSPQNPQPSPELFFATVNAYQQTAALKAAVELDLFTAVGSTDGTVEAVARRTGAAARGVRILCDYLTILGFLLKEGNRYRLTLDSAVFLDRRSPDYFGDSLRFLLSPLLVDAFKDLTAAVRKGGTTMPGEGTVVAENPIWVEFARSMAPLTTRPAAEIARLVPLDPNRPAKVLDIAAGHGKFGIAFAERYPNAEIVALDWVNVLEVARENARASKVDGRFRTIAGSAFDVDYGKGYAVVLLTNFLHHWDVPTCERLLGKVHAALEPDGRAVTLEFVPNEDRISPPAAASFSLMMLGGTPAGDAYTFSEIDRMFRNARFGSSTLHALPGGLQSVVVSRKS